MKHQWGIALGNARKKTELKKQWQYNLEVILFKVK